jgi:anti-sigma regulatory factor (Ser/Thr protein kinase)
VNSRSGRVDVTLPADANAPAMGRRSVAGLSSDLSEETIFRLRLLVSDALSNRVLEHASAGGGGAVRLELMCDAHTVRGRITDVDFAAPADDRQQVPIAPLQAGLLEALADRWGTSGASEGAAQIWFELGGSDVRTNTEFHDRFRRGAAGWTTPRAAG